MSRPRTAAANPAEASSVKPAAVPAGASEPVTADWCERTGDSGVVRDGRYRHSPRMIVPTPCSVKISSSSTCWMRPSRMTAASTPF